MQVQNKRQEIFCKILKMFLDIQQVGNSEASESRILEAQNPGPSRIEMAAEWNRMGWSRIPPGLQNHSWRLPGTLKFVFGNILGSKMGRYGPSGQPSGHSDDPCRFCRASSLYSREAFWHLGELYWTPWASILRVPARPTATFFRSGCDSAKNMKT